MNTPDFTTHQNFRCCPNCGAPELSYQAPNRYNCPSCTFVFYQNNAAACGAILTYHGNILLLVRGKQPALGKLDLPGGFIDPGESAEEALQREIMEGIGLEARNLRYFSSAPNLYEYRGVRYPTCDLIFTGELPHPPRAIQESEISGWILEEPGRLDLDRIAFPSIRGALEGFLRGRTKGALR